jgi:uncharacterized protein (DUF305 family)
MIQKKIDDAAIMWNKTKDPQYKDLWYQLIKEYTNGINNMERWTLPTDSSHKTNNGRYSNNS